MMQKLLQSLYIVIITSGGGPAVSEVLSASLPGTWREAICSEAGPLLETGARIDFEQVHGNISRVSLWDSDYRDLDSFGYHSSCSVESAQDDTSPRNITFLELSCQTKITREDGRVTTVQSEGNIIAEEMANLVQFTTHLDGRPFWHARQMIMERCTAGSLAEGPILPKPQSLSEKYAETFKNGNQICPLARASVTASCSKTSIVGNLQVSFDHTVRAQTDGWVHYQSTPEIVAFSPSEEVRDQSSFLHDSSKLRLFDIVFDTFSEEEVTSGKAEKIRLAFLSLSSAYPLGREWPYVFESYQFHEIVANTISELERRYRYNLRVKDINESNDKVVREIGSKLSEIEEKIANYNDIIYSLSSSTAILNQYQGAGKDLMDAALLKLYQESGGFAVYLEMTKELFDLKRNFKAQLESQTSAFEGLSNERLMADLEADFHRLEQEIATHFGMTIPCERPCFVDVGEYWSREPKWVTKGEPIARTSDSLTRWEFIVPVQDARLLLHVSQAALKIDPFLCGGIESEAPELKTVGGVPIWGSMNSSEAMLQSDLPLLGNSVGDGELDLEEIIPSYIWIDRLALEEELRAAGAEGDATVEVPIEFVRVPEARLIALAGIDRVLHDVSLVFEISESAGVNDKLVCLGE